MPAREIDFIFPMEGRFVVEVPEATPVIVSAHARSEEALLLAQVRYCRLIDIFLEITSWPLENHLRAKLDGGGPFEVDDLYVGMRQDGRQFIIPVQAGTGSCRITHKHIAWCAERFPGLLCRAVSVQPTPKGAIAMIELAIADGAVGVLHERHYRPVAWDKLLRVGSQNKPGSSAQLSRR